MRCFGLVAILLFASASASAQTLNAARDAVHTALAPAANDPDLKFSYETSLVSVLGQSEQQLDGLVEVTVSVRRIGDRLERVVTLHSPAVYLRGVELGELQASVWLPATDDEAIIEATVRGRAHRLAVRGRGQLTFDAAKRAWAVDDRSLHGRIDLFLSSMRPLTDRVRSGAVVVTARRDAPQAPLRVAAGVTDLQFGGVDYGDVTVEALMSREELEVMARLVNGGRELAVGQLTARVPDGRVTRLIEGEGEATLAVRKVDPEFVRPWVKPLAGVDYSLDATLRMAGRVGSWSMEARLDGEGSLPGASGPVTVVVTGDQDGQSWDGAWGEYAALRGRTVLSRRWTDSLADGALDLSFPLSSVAPFTPFLGAIEGEISGSLTWDGRLGKPNITGPMQVTNGAVTVVPANRRVVLEKARGVFEQDVFAFEALGGSGPGTATVKGSVELRPADFSMVSKANLVLERFPVVATDFPILLVGAELDLERTVVGTRRDTRISVRRAAARVLDEDLPSARTIPSNDDVEFVDSSVRKTRSRKAHERWALTLDAPVRIVGQGTDLAVTGGLTVDRLGDVVRVDGALETSALSTFELFDNKFTIRAGRLSFQPGNLRRPLRVSDTGLVEPRPLEPIIDLVADRKEGDTWVLVRMDGAFAKPELTLKSLPALPEYQIMTLLITGRVDSVDDRSGNVRRAVARMVERYHNPSLERQLFDRIGIDKVGLGFRSSVTNPVLTVGKQITKTLYFETIYRHSAPPDLNMMEGHVEKRFGRRWTIDTVFGDAAEGRFGAFWRATFGGPVHPKPTEADLQLSLVVDGDADGDGVTDLFDVCAGKPEDRDGFRDDDGCPDPDNDGDGVPDVTDAAPLQAETFNGADDKDGAPDAWPHDVAAIRGATRSLVFERNRTSLTAVHREYLRTIVELIAELPNSRVVVEGHSDTSGDPPTHQRVSEDRANRVARELRRLGIARDRISVEAHGAEKPVAVPAGEEGKGVHRRVVIRLEPSDAP